MEKDVKSTKKVEVKAHHRRISSRSKKMDQK